MAVILALLVLLVLPLPSHAVTWWVDAVAGNNSDSCQTEALACSSISGVLAKGIGPGDTINFLRNQYHRITSGQVVLSVNGTSANPITLQSAPTGGGARAILSGAELWNSGWTQSGALWWHSLGTQPGRHLWVDKAYQSHDASQFVSHGAGCEANLVSDQQWCWNSSTNRLYFRSATNPGSRFTSPGVEVVTNFQTSGMGLLSLSGNWWVIRDIDFHMGPDWNLKINGADNIVYEDSENNYTRPHSLLPGDGGGNNLDISASAGTTAENITVRNITMLDAGRNTVSIGSGGTVRNLLMEDIVINRAFNHSILNTGLSGAGGTRQNLTFRRWKVEAACDGWHSGNTGTAHTSVLFDRWWVLDGVESGDARVYDPGEGCGTESIGFIADDGIPYTIRDSIITGQTIGIRHNAGTLTLDNTVLHNNTRGVQFRSPAASQSLIATDNIITGTGGVSSSSFAVGCVQNCAIGSIWSTSSNNNKLHMSGGAGPIGFLSGVDASVTFAEWQTRYSSDAASTNTDDCFVSAGTSDYNLATGCNDIAANRGPFREIAYLGGTITGSSLVATLLPGSTAPVESCNASQATVTYNTVPQTALSCTPAVPGVNNITLTMATAPGAATVTLAGAYALAEDSMEIGGELNAKSRAFTAQPVTNLGGEPTTGCVVGTTRSVAPGTNRVMTVHVGWEKVSPTTTPLSITSCTYGGQALTKIAEALLPDDALSHVLASQWMLAETGIAAASTQTLTCTGNNAVDSTRPMILASCVYEDIVQPPGSSVLGFKTATEAVGTSVSTAALDSTSNPGVAVVMAMAGTHGAWTPAAGWMEQVDVAEDGSPGGRLLVADRVTSGNTPTGSATYTNFQPGFPPGLAMITTALNGGDPQPPPAEAVVTQTASRCALHSEPQWTWQTGAEGQPCTVVPDHHLILVSGWSAQTATDMETKALYCDAGSGPFAVGETFTPGPVAFSPEGVGTDGEVLPVRLVGSGTTYVPGVHRKSDTLLPITVAPGQDSALAHTVHFAPSLAPPLTVTCALRHGDGQVLDSYGVGNAAQTTIQVVKGVGRGW